MPFSLPKTLVSETVFQGGTIYKVDVTIYFTGTIDFEITADANAASPTWEKVTLVSGIKSIHTFAVEGSNIQYRITSLGGVISAQQNGNGEWTAPGIKIKAYYR